MQQERERVEGRVQASDKSVATTFYSFKDHKGCAADSVFAWVKPVWVCALEIFEPCVGHHYPLVIFAKVNTKVIR